MLPYIKFIEITNKITKLDKFPAMSPLSQKILDQIALYASGDNPLTVREMLDFDQIASPQPFISTWQGYANLTM